MSFRSQDVVAGSTMSAYWAVGVRKWSCTTTNSTPGPVRAATLLFTLPHWFTRSPATEYMSLMSAG